MYLCNSKILYTESIELLHNVVIFCIKINGFSSKCKKNCVYFSNYVAFSNVWFLPTNTSILVWFSIEIAYIKMESM